MKGAGGVKKDRIVTTTDNVNLFRVVYERVITVEAEDKQEALYKADTGDVLTDCNDVFVYEKVTRDDYEEVNRFINGNRIL
jgi:hypothetical protein